MIIQDVLLPRKRRDKIFLVKTLGGKREKACKLPSLLAGTRLHGLQCKCCAVLVEEKWAIVDFAFSGPSRA
jgi:hypothetical protein